MHPSKKTHIKKDRSSQNLIAQTSTSMASDYLAMTILCTTIPQDDKNVTPQEDPQEKKARLYKTEFCRNWDEENACKYGDKCQYAHGQDDLRYVQRHPKYKTESCRTFETLGTCPYGIRCTFIHETHSPQEDRSLSSISTSSSTSTLSKSSSDVTRKNTISSDEQTKPTLAPSSSSSSLQSYPNICTPFLPFSDNTTRQVSEQQQHSQLDNYFVYRQSDHSSKPFFLPHELITAFNNCKMSATNSNSNSNGFHSALGLSPPLSTGSICKYWKGYQ
ncbi:uncharacterized protein BX664DRAFT_383867 [Halteromyces radiatus]|uniref:uncharacterized protein n=1 Tax=Halteromyces radiatus TaxID=101107 RepID=UPI00221F81B1|nr:uncharacterized protein BX664DRAFT_383867 [Halteromyces radiatus]KAI8097608.1 hypothetical protein BX664DRAFT_383867 [Halteromyces radiatus]